VDGESAGLRVSVRVRTGASRPGVGGRYGTDALLVAVAARPVDGAANAAVTDALARAFAVPRRAVELVAGCASRSKVVRIAGDPATLRARLAQLLAL
jgi:uncharacterized protein